MSAWVESRQRRRGVDILRIRQASADVSTGRKFRTRMTNPSRMALVAASVAFCLASIAAPAAAGCWTSADIAAARVREMQTKLAVAALQCRFSRVDIRASYNRFLRNGRSALRAANGRLKAHFMAQGRTG